MAMQTKWIQFSCVVSNDFSESLGALLMENGALGIVEETSNTPLTTTLQVFLDDPCPPSLKEEFEFISSSFFAESFTWKAFEDDGWSENWKAFFRPLLIGEKLLVCPDWEIPPPSEHRKTLWIEPGMAFGTGQHATTESCLLLLEQIVQPSMQVADIGCGSGILAIAASLLGASSIFGIDNDPDVIPIAQENAIKNNVQENTSFAFLPIEQISNSFDLVIANIQAHILIPMVDELTRITQNNGFLVLSGILEEKKEGVVQCFQEKKWKVTQEIIKNNWVTLLLQQTQD